MTAALQVYSKEFDSDFFKLSADLQKRIESSIDKIGASISQFPHRKLTGVDAYRVRVGNYRIIYDIDVEKGVLYLLVVGHRREVYRL